MRRTVQPYTVDGLAKRIRAMERAIADLNRRGPDPVTGAEPPSGPPAFLTLYKNDQVITSSPDVVDVQWSGIAASRGSSVTWSSGDPKDIVIAEPGRYLVTQFVKASALVDQTAGSDTAVIYTHLDFFEPGTDPDVAGQYGGSSDYHHPIQWHSGSVLLEPSVDSDYSFMSGDLPSPSSVMHLPAGMVIRQLVDSAYDGVMRFNARFHIVKLS